MSADTLMVMGQDPMLSGTMQDKGEQMPFKFGSVDPAGKSWLSGDNVFGGQRMARQLYPDLYRSMKPSRYGSGSPFGGIGGGGGDGQMGAMGSK